MKFKIILFFLFSINLCFSQNLKIVSQEKNTPIEDVIILSKQGSFIALTNTEGEIDQTLLIDSDYYILSHPTFEIDTLFINKIINNEYRVKQIREITLPEIIITDSKDVFTIKGYFNSYVIHDGKFDAFIDGIAEFVFDGKNNKLKKKNIIEYRSFILESEGGNNAKRVSNTIFDPFEILPDLKFIQKLISILEKEAENSKINTFTNENGYEFSASVLNNETMNLFGCIFSRMDRSYTFYLKTGAFNLWDLTRCSSVYDMSIRHKSEKEFSDFISVSNFYPSEISFKNKKKLMKGVKFDKDKSSYNTAYWENEMWASFYKYLSSQFSESLILQENTNNL